MNLSLAFVFIHLGIVTAQFPKEATDLTTKHLNNHSGVSITYKETKLCDRNAKSWAGHVHMPSTYLSDIATAAPYNVSMFFWYFEAENHPRHAQTGIYLAGGPGQPSSIAAVSPGGGACSVLSDANTTVPNAFSWSTNMNMLYIDQPVSTGFSYTTKVKSTLDMLFLGDPITATGITPFEAYNDTIPPQNTTSRYGTFSEQNPNKTANSTLTAAKTLWHFSQVWFSSFPEYKTANKQISLWGNSYGGYYVPVTAEYMTKQNVLIRDNKLNGTVLPVDAVGWTNGCVDLVEQGQGYPEQAYNNTYGLQVISEAAYKQALADWSDAGGCRDQILECRRLGDLHDPERLNRDATVTKACIDAELFCATKVMGAYDVVSNRSDFDMAHLKPDPFPPAYSSGFFNRAWVQDALGVSVNFTSSLLANNVFLYATGDPIRTDGSKSVEYLLEHGVKVVMMYGDRDYRCPWNGAETLSLALRWKGQDAFKKAGYEYVQTDKCTKGKGVVRQHRNLSFVRILDAGHDGKNSIL